MPRFNDRTALPAIGGGGWTGARLGPVPSTAPDQSVEVPTSIRVRLWAALAIVVAETSLEIAFVFARDDYGPGGKALVGGLFALKILFAWGVVRLNPGAVFGLLLFELTGILVALGADFAMGVRLLLVACVIAVFALVGSSLSAFESPGPMIPPR